MPDLPADTADYRSELLFSRKLRVKPSFLRLDDALAQALCVKAEGMTGKLFAGLVEGSNKFPDVMGDKLPFFPPLHDSFDEGCEGGVEKKQASLAACKAKEFGNEGGVLNPQSSKVPARRRFFQGSQYCSRAGSGMNFLGVRKRRGIHGYPVVVRPPKWKKTIWLGTFDTAEEAAGAYDAGRFLTRKNGKYNFPDLMTTIPPLPSHLRFDSEKDSEEIKIFVQKQARLAARAAKDNGMKPCGTRPTPNEEIKHVETKPEAETAATQGRQQDAEVEQEDVMADITGGFQMDQHLNGEAGAAESDHQSNYQSLIANPVSIVESDDESGSDGSSSWTRKESEAEVTADRICRESDSTSAGRERSRDPIDDETLISRLVPFMRKEVEEALDCTLLPLVSALRSREEEEVKHREKMLALEVQKLALKREKLLFKRRRLARSQPQRRPSAAMARSASTRHGLQVKKNRAPH